MNRSLAFLSGSLVWMGVTAQFQILPHDTIIDPSSPDRHRITASTWADYNSGSLNNELPLKLHQGGYLSRDLRERSRNNLASENSAGFDLGLRLTWTGTDSLFGRPRMRPLASLAHRNMLGARFSRDAYELAFFGNARFEDQVATLAPSAHAQISWQSAGFGVQDAVDHSFIRLDILRGRSFNASDLRHADLYTAPDGLHLLLDTDASYWRSDTAGKGGEHTNGMGASISGQWNLKRELIGMPVTWSMALEDLGFMHWNRNSIRMERDTSIVYEGLEVENIFDLGDVLIGEQQVLDTLGIAFTHGAYSTLMPFRAALAMELALDAFWHTRLSIDHRYLPGYMPQVMLNASRRIGDRALVGVSGAYGGFGVLRIGLAARFRFGDHILAELGSSHVPGFFTGTTRGAGAFLSITAIL